ncbi:MAG: hypothetical protein IJD16_02310 [Desulfovibrio sp.]|nr:hypothetical protein [Desulfovibrio sp.]
MEKLLTRLARQLDALDEASLMSLWSKYATVVSRFEPTRRWEEAALIFSLVQAKRWKNQLFNYYWAQQSRPAQGPPSRSASAPGPDRAPDFFLEPPAPSPTEKIRCRVLSFRPSGAARKDQGDHKPDKT